MTLLSSEISYYCLGDSEGRPVEPGRKSFRCPSEVALTQLVTMAPL